VNRRSSRPAPAVVRNLDHLQEQAEQQPSRISALVMASFGGACIVFAALVLMRSPGQDEQPPPDPLGDLVAGAQAPSGSQRPPALAEEQVTFPDLLSDQDNPTTAMELVRAKRRAAGSGAGEPPAEEPPAGPPPATDQLPVVPLPAQEVLHGSKAKIPPADMLRSVAEEVAREPAAETAAPGTPGGYQLQVSSFQSAADAEAFAAALRRRGHRAYVEAAHVRGRGLWHRVRIGPFKYQRSAQIYRQRFEAKERLVAIIIAPPRTKVRLGLADEGG